MTFQLPSLPLAASASTIAASAVAGMPVRASAMAEGGAKRVLAPSARPEATAPRLPRRSLRCPVPAAILRLSLLRGVADRARRSSTSVGEILAGCSVAAHQATAAQCGPAPPASPLIRLPSRSSSRSRSGRSGRCCCPGDRRVSPSPSAARHKRLASSVCASGIDHPGRDWPG